MKFIRDKITNQKTQISFQIYYLQNLSYFPSLEVLVSKQLNPNSIFCLKFESKKNKAINFKIQKSIAEITLLLEIFLEIEKAFILNC